MKKYLCALTLIVSVVGICMAQDETPKNKKVAVWEVQAESDNISPMNKLQIQGAMEKAIASAAGYEAYNRNALETIMAEQNFQRGGNVSDNQIREIGKMAGVDYILLLKTAKEGNELFVTANILDIETGKYGESDNELMESTGKSIQDGCSRLASRLFNTSMNSEVRPTNIAKAPAQTTKPVQQAQPIQQTQPVQQNYATNQYNDKMCTQGRLDANSFYKGRHSGSGWTLALTILGSPVIGLIPAVINSNSPIKDEDLGIRDQNLIKDSSYYQCYYNEAKKKKSKKNWKNWGIGTAAIAVFLALSLPTLNM